jgi:hypothetical protein
MSLKAFHVAFVTLSVVLAVIVAWWAFDAWRAGGGGGMLALAAGAVVAGVALVAYGVWFLKKMKGVSLL